jgi:O-antigen/teichoic acid export membrane protein
VEIVRRALKGIFWSYATYVWQRLFTLATTAILARILVPEDFGLVAFAIIIMTLIEATRGFGINDALIYTSEQVEEAAETAFLINTAIGVAQFAIAYLLAPLTLHFIDDVRIVSILRVISFVFVIDGLGKTHEALLQKDLKFRKSAIPEIIATAIKGIVSIVLAVMGYGVWSIVFGQLVGTVAQTTAKWWALRWIPRLRFSLDRARALWQYGVHILSFSLLNVLLEQADQVLIATMIGQIQLGYYSIGARIPEMVIANFSLILGKTLFPTFSKLNNDMARMRTAYLMTTKYTALVTIPTALGLVAVAPELVIVVFGDQWGPAIPLLQVLALLGMAATLQWAVGDVLKAIGRPDVSTKLLLTEALYTFPLIYWFTSTTRLALMASLANMLALVIGAVVRMIVITRFLDLKPTVFYTIFRSPFLSAGSMFLVIQGWRYFANTLGLPLFVILVVSVLIGVIIYAILIWLMEKDAILEARDTVLSTMRKSKNEDEPIDETSDELEVEQE